MNHPYHKELSELFASDCDALVDEAFVQRCITSFRRAQRRLLVLKLVIVCAAAGIVGLVSPSLADSVTAISNWLSAAALDLAVIVPSWLSSAVATLDSRIGGIVRALAVVVALVLVVRRYGFPSFRFPFRETQP